MAGKSRKVISLKICLGGRALVLQVCCCVGYERGKHKGAFIDVDMNKTESICEAPAFLSVHVFMLSILTNLTGFRQQYQCLIDKVCLCSLNLHYVAMEIIISNCQVA